MRVGELGGRHIDLYFTTKGTSPSNDAYLSSNHFAPMTGILPSSRLPSQRMQLKRRFG